MLLRKEAKCVEIVRTLHEHAPPLGLVYLGRKKCNGYISDPQSRGYHFGHLPQMWLLGHSTDVFTLFRQGGGSCGVPKGRAKSG